MKSFALSLVLFANLGGGDLLAQDGPNLYGRVVTASGAGIPGATVAVTCGPTGSPGSSVTGASGDFGVDVWLTRNRAKCQIDVSAPGYLTLRVTDVELTIPLKERLHRDFTLQQSSSDVGSKTLPALPLKDVLDSKMYCSLDPACQPSVGAQPRIADSGPVLLEGSVVDPLGGVLPTADVVITLKNEVVAHVRTDKHGIFKFRAAAGAYTVEIKYPLNVFAPIRSKGVVFSEGKPQIFSLTLGAHSTQFRPSHRTGMSNLEAALSL